MKVQCRRDLQEAAEGSEFEGWELRSFAFSMFRLTQPRIAQWYIHGWENIRQQHRPGQSLWEWKWKGDGRLGGPGEKERRKANARL